MKHETSKTYLKRPRNIVDSPHSVSSSG